MKEHHSKNSGEKKIYIFCSQITYTLRTTKKQHSQNDGKARSLCNSRNEHYLSGCMRQDIDEKQTVLGGADSTGS